MHFAAADFDYTTLAIVIGCFIVVFLALWFGIAWLISRCGWKKFCVGLECPTPPEGVSVNVTNLVFGSFASYNNITTGTFSPEGVHLRVRWLFNKFHPAMFVPWSLIESAGQRTYLFVRLRVLTAVSHGVTCRIRMTGAAWQKVKHLVPAQFQMD